MINRQLTRRTVLKAAATLPLVISMPSFGLAEVLPGQRKFLFLLAPGGWDSTMVFEPPRNADSIDRSVGSRLTTVGGLRWTSAPSRPSVDRFFRRWGHRAAIVNGIHTRSSGHTAATNLMLTGDAAPSRPDWPTLLAHTSEPVVARPASPLSGSSFAESLCDSVEPLRSGRSRCALLQIPGTWDTHYDNAPQSPQFEVFFYGLDRLFDHMSQTPGYAAPRLLDEIVVVALSELGRSPGLNAAGGKHHWPFTSALLAGPGVAGGRVIGATDAGLEALSVDFYTGHPARSGDIIQGENLGATLLHLGGLSPAKHLPSVQNLGALLA